jgi:hypothetical protein
MADESAICAYDFVNQVGIADEISNIKFIEDFDKIVNFILAMQTSK